ncbi:hypothetical protein H310_04252 [Aphanomyces invadans]|uniref:Uncharacterized protein n=1 Tax=Aphanomyces invadans TaxID=157072 RepID=A0A024UG88_9STRA|nr:hypothetical protein H310_04252 [Aphanomyces invadans]ETW05299.1 hypothetical protein H310_04252 [Aphanomyces invadans]|eukprot:XP_008866737.1 hypothetical protein H310_04252 [Aphanomyces invadans]
MLSFSCRIPGYDNAFRVLVDCGASENYARRTSIQGNPSIFADAVRRADPHASVRVKMADGKVVSSPKILVDLHVTLEGFSSMESFFVIDLDDRWDLILGMRWLELHQPRISWRTKRMSPPASADLGAMSNELSPLPAQAPFAPRRTLSAFAPPLESAAFGDAAVPGDDVCSAASSDAAALGDDVESAAVGDAAVPSDIPPLA